MQIKFLHRHVSYPISGKLLNITFGGLQFNAADFSGAALMDRRINRINRMEPISHGCSDDRRGFQTFGDKHS
jgi:hypothetical protein